MSAYDDPMPPPLPPSTPAFEQQPSPADAPPPWPPIPRRPSRARNFLAGSLVAVVVAGAVAGGILAFRLTRGSGDSMAAMVPSDAAVYANISLDPPASQKMAINDLLSKFPLVGGANQRDQWINQALDSAGAPAGLNHSDIRPWLGSQVAFLAQLPALAGGFPRSSPRQPVFSNIPAASLAGPGLAQLADTNTASATPSPFALLISSRDDSQAQAALNKFKSGPVGSKLTWSTSTYDGVAVTSGQGSESTPVVWAIVNHSVVLAGSAPFADEIIDTAHGKHASLDSTGDYKDVVARLPSDHFAFFYINFPQLVQSFSGVFSLLGGPNAQAQIAALGAYRGIGAAAVATSDGLAIDGVANFDSSKLPAQTRALLAVPPHQNGALAFVPSHAYGLLAVTGLQQILQSFIGSAGALGGGRVGNTLDQLGITGPGGVINHLTGDAGVEVDAVPGASIPAGAFVFATDSASSAQTFLEKLSNAVCQMSNQCDTSRATRESYKGVTVTSLPMRGDVPAGLAPSWAVVDNWGILASSVDEVKAVIDTHSTSGITSSPNYAAISSDVSTSNNDVLYVNVQAILAAIRATLSTGDRSFFDAVIAPSLRPLTAIEITGTNASDHVSSTFFLKIG